MITIVIVAGMALAVLVWLRRARTAWRSGRLMPEALVHVSFDDGEIVCSYPEGTVRRVAWADITRVGLRTTSEGPWLPDVFWGLHAGHDEPAIVFPQGATGEPELLQAFQQRLPGFDDEELIRAMGTTTDRTFLLWSRTAAPIAPSSGTNSPRNPVVRPVPNGDERVRCPESSASRR